MSIEEPTGMVEPTIKPTEGNEEGVRTLNEDLRRQFQKQTNKLAKLLDENDGGPRYLIFQVVRLLGIPESQELADQAIEIFSGEGMLTSDGRKRTLGGIFFVLAKQRIPKKQWLFYSYRADIQSGKIQPRAKSTSQPGAGIILTTPERITPEQLADLYRST